MKEEYKLPLIKYDLFNHSVELDSTLYLIGIGGCEISLLLNCLNQ